MGGQAPEPVWVLTAALRLLALPRASQQRVELARPEASGPSAQVRLHCGVAQGPRAVKGRGASRISGWKRVVSTFYLDGVSRGALPKRVLPPKCQGGA